MEQFEFVVENMGEYSMASKSILLYTIPFVAELSFSNYFYCPSVFVCLQVEQLESVVENMGDDSMALKASIDELRNSPAVGMQSRPHLPNRVYPQDAEIVDDITELRY